MKHTFFNCTCNRYGCPYCDGGLGFCTTCKGIEGSLASDCPGKRLTNQTLDAIWKGYIDFKDGRWVTGRLWWDGKMHTWKEWHEKQDSEHELRIPDGPF